MTREKMWEEFETGIVDVVERWKKRLEQEPCEDVCEWFEQYVDIETDIVEFRFSDGTAKRAKRGLYMRDIEKSIRKMLIDQMANEKKQEPKTDICDNRIKDELNRVKDELEPKTGHWKRISMDRYTTHAQYWYECDKCGEHNLGNTGYCPSCGARMIEPQESEDKE